MTQPLHVSQPPRWTPPFLTLPIHATVRHQLRLGLDDVESTLIVGPRGAGKTQTMTTLIEELRTEQLRQQLASGIPPRNILWYATADAHGSKTVLSDIYGLLKDRPMGKRSKQDWTPTEYVRQITETLKDENIALICIDEAQKIDASNIDLLRQLVDAAPQHGHTVRLVLVGNEELTRQVAATGQLGERFTGFVTFPPFAAGQVSAHLSGFHPGLEALRTTLASKAWKALERELFAAAGGSFRRLCAIIANAHELALLHGGTMTEQDLRLAIAKLPPGVA